jgi:hypothetical protein
MILIQNDFQDRVPLLLENPNRKLNGIAQKCEDPEENPHYDINRDDVQVKKDQWNLQINEARKSITDTKIFSFVEESSVNKDLVIEANIWDVFNYPNVRKKFLLLTFVWIANAVVYNGLSYNVTSLGVNDYLAFFIC